jgi:hypothetical protein
MKKIVSAVLALGVCVVLPAIADAQTTSQDEIKKELAAMRAQLAAQMEKIEALESKLEKVEKEKIEVKAEEKAAGKVALANKFINQLTLKSDLRVRYDRLSRNYYNQATDDDYNRDRWRTRFRIGLIWDNEAEDWQVGAGLIANDQNRATNSNGTWSEDSPFDRHYVSLDYAYAKHKWDDFTFTLGQQPNPYEMAWVMYDGDVRFVGLTAQYGQKTGPFATLGGYGAKLVGDDSADNTGMLYYGQAGYRGAAGDVEYTLAAAYQSYDQSFINDMKSNTDYSYPQIDPDKYGLDIGDLYGEVSFPAGTAKVTTYGQIWKNFGADGEVGQSQIRDFPEKPGDADMGWAVGVNSKIQKFYLGLDYSVIEADALYGLLADADFGSGMSQTNKKGYRLQAGYDFTKNWSALISYLWYEQEEDFYASSSKVEDADIIFVDAKYKF